MEATDSGLDLKESGLQTKGSQEFPPLLSHRNPSGGSPISPAAADIAPARPQSKQWLGLPRAMQAASLAPCRCRGNGL